MEFHAYKQKVVVVGAGPVGALAALYAAKRGDEVHVYELRGDLRDPSTTPLNFTRSINLALSERGINSMREAYHSNLLDGILNETIPMHARMIHGRKKNEVFQESQEYDAHGRYIRAVDRAGLNKRLLDAVENFPNVSIHFNHKLTGANFNKKVAWFEQQNATQRSDSTNGRERAPEIEVDFDFLIGADGAHSAVRFHMMKFARVNYQQEYIDTLWCEFLIPPRQPDSTFALDPNHLHIWPAGSFMFIAIPSLDKSFTCTLFASKAHFDSISDDSKIQLPDFFNRHFPGVTPQLISPEQLHKQFNDNPHLPLISIKCRPYHYNSSVIILGDAAHAMVPFYGQGMNAGLEDVRVLFDILDSKGVYDETNSNAQLRERARAAALSEYTSQRAPDAAAINDLALRNYEEMRSSVRSPTYKIRKWMEETVNIYLPILNWRTQYTRVSFENQRYSEIERDIHRQGQLLLGFVGIGLAVVGGAGMYGVWRGGRDTLHNTIRWLTQKFR